LLVFYIQLIKMHRETVKFTCSIFNYQQSQAESFASCLKTINVEVVSLRVGSLHTGTSGELWTTRVFPAREWFDKTLQEFSQLTPLTSLL
jgi:hypothetical protein